MQSPCAIYCQHGTERIEIVEVQFYTILYVIVLVPICTYQIMGMRLLLIYGNDKVASYYILGDIKML